MEYNELMKAFCKNLGLDGVEPDADGNYSLSLDGTTVAFIELPDSGLMDIVARIGEIPTDDGNGICKKLLKAMAPGSNAEEYTFFIAPDEQAVFLRRTEVLAALSADSFRQVLIDFATTLDKWRGIIGNSGMMTFDSDEDASQQAEAEVPFGMNTEGFLQV